MAPPYHSRRSRAHEYLDAVLASFAIPNNSILSENAFRDVHHGHHPYPKVTNTLLRLASSLVRHIRYA
jgi:hypothetical protein